jgi:eukaryotic-like serine/threonine-protein kinase
VSSNRWEKLQQIFIAALQREPGERLVFAREACRGDASLQAEVESLLRCYDEESGFLKEPALGTGAADWILRNLNPSADPNFGETKPLPSSWKAPRDLPEAESPAPAFAGAARAPARHPAAIGCYRILRLVGEGGMGSVYEAEQEQPRRIVALKLIKPGLAGSL